MKIPTHEEFTDHIEDHLEETGEKPSAFGRRVLNDAAAIPSLMEGTDPRRATMEKIAKAIEKAIENAISS